MRGMVGKAARNSGLRILRSPNCSNSGTLVPCKKCSSAAPVSNVRRARAPVAPTGPGPTGTTLPGASQPTAIGLPAIAIKLAYCLVTGSARWVPGRQRPRVEGRRRPRYRRKRQPCSVDVKTVRRWAAGGVPPRFSPWQAGWPCRAVRRTPTARVRRPRPQLLRRRRSTRLPRRCRRTSRSPAS